VELEEKTGRSVVTGENFLPLRAAVGIERKAEVNPEKKVRKKVRVIK